MISGMKFIKKSLFSFLILSLSCCIVSCSKSSSSKENALTESDGTKIDLNSALSLATKLDSTPARDFVVAANSTAREMGTEAQSSLTSTLLSSLSSNELRRMSNLGLLSARYKRKTLSVNEEATEGAGILVWAQNNINESGASLCANNENYCFQDLIEDKAANTLNAFYKDCVAAIDGVKERIFTNYARSKGLECENVTSEECTHARSDFAGLWKKLLIEYSITSDPDKPYQYCENRVKEKESYDAAHEQKDMEKVSYVTITDDCQVVFAFRNPVKWLSQGFVEKHYPTNDKTLKLKKNQHLTDDAPENPLTCQLFGLAKISQNNNSLIPFCIDDQRKLEMSINDDLFAERKSIQVQGSRIYFPAREKIYGGYTRPSIFAFDFKNEADNTNLTLGEPIKILDGNEVNIHSYFVDNNADTVKGLFAIYDDVLRNEIAFKFIKAPGVNCSLVNGVKQCENDVTGGTMLISNRDYDYEVEFGFGGILWFIGQNPDIFNTTGHKNIYKLSIPTALNWLSKYDDITDIGRKSASTINPCSDEITNESIQQYCPYKMLLEGRFTEEMEGNASYAEDLFKFSSSQSRFDENNDFNKTKMQFVEYQDTSARKYRRLFVSGKFAVTAGSEAGGNYFRSVWMKSMSCGDEDCVNKYCVKNVQEGSRTFFNVGETMSWFEPYVGNKNETGAMPMMGRETPRKYYKPGSDEATEYYYYDEWDSDTRTYKTVCGVCETPSSDFTDPDNSCTGPGCMNEFTASRCSSEPNHFAQDMDTGSNTATYKTCCGDSVQSGTYSMTMYNYDEWCWGPPGCTPVNNSSNDNWIGVWDSSKEKYKCNYECATYTYPGLSKIENQDECPERKFVKELKMCGMTAMGMGDDGGCSTGYECKRIGAVENSNGTTYYAGMLGSFQTPTNENENLYRPYSANEAAHPLVLLVNANLTSPTDLQKSPFYKQNDMFCNDCWSNWGFLYTRMNDDAMSNPFDMEVYPDRVAKDMGKTIADLNNNIPGGQEYLTYLLPYSPGAQPFDLNNITTNVPGISMLDADVDSPVMKVISSFNCDRDGDGIASNTCYDTPTRMKEVNRQFFYESVDGGVYFISFLKPTDADYTTFKPITIKANAELKDIIQNPAAVNTEDENTSFVLYYKDNSSTAIAGVNDRKKMEFKITDECINETNGVNTLKLDDVSCVTITTISKYVENIIPFTDEGCSINDIVNNAPVIGDIPFALDYSKKER